MQRRAEPSGSRQNRSSRAAKTDRVELPKQIELTRLNLVEHGPIGGDGGRGVTRRRRRWYRQKSSVSAPVEVGPGGGKNTAMTG
jgi:hypothetical protein